MVATQLAESVTDGLRQEVSEFLRSRPDLGPADLAQHTNLAPGTVRNWIGGRLPGGFQIIGEMRRVLGQAQAGDILQPGGEQSVVLREDQSKRVRKVARAGKLYQTQTVRKIGEVLDYCAEQATIGVITADFGVGKTEGVKAWMRTHAGAVDAMVFEFDEFSAHNKVDFVRLLGQSFGLSASAGMMNGGAMFRAVCEYLRENPCLLIFDQCESVRPRVAQVIRQIHDRTKDAGVGVVMLAAPIFLQRLLGGKMVDLGALTSRVGIWAPLSGLTRPEMAAIVKGEGFIEIDENAFDLWFKATTGSMRRLMRSLELLRAKHAGKRVTERTIAGVAGMLWGISLTTEVA